MIGAVLGQKIEKMFQVINYVSRTLNNAPLNYTTIEKELLAICFAFDKFWPYLIGNKVIEHIDYSAIKYLMTKKDAKLMLIQGGTLTVRFLHRDKSKKGNRESSHGPPFLVGRA